MELSFSPILPNTWKGKHTEKGREGERVKEREKGRNEAGKNGERERERGVLRERV